MEKRANVAGCAIFSTLIAVFSLRKRFSAQGLNGAKLSEPAREPWPRIVASRQGMIERMKIGNLFSNFTGPNEISTAGSFKARLLAGQLPDVPLGSPIEAEVVDAAADQAVLKLEGARLLVEGLSGQTVGTQLPVRITSLAPFLQLKVESPSLPAAVSLPPLALGQELNVRVLSNVPGEGIQIDLAGTRVNASAPEGLTPGAELHVRVEQLRPTVVLQIQAQGPPVESIAVELLRTHLAQQPQAAATWEALHQAIAQVFHETAPEAIPDTIRRLQTLLESLLPQDAAPTPQEIAGLVRDSGIQYESKLAQAIDQGPQALRTLADQDIKGLVLRALQELEPSPASASPLGGAGRSALPSGLPGAASPIAEPAGGPAGLVNSLAVHLGNIESQQALNLLAQVHGTPYQFQIPFFTGKQLTTALLAVEADDRGPSAGETPERGHNLFFQLDLDELGRTRIDAHVAARSLRVVFYVENSAGLARLNGELPMFQDHLRSQGYAEVLLAARPWKQIPPDKEQKFASLAVGVPEPVRLVDVRA